MSNMAYNFHARLPRRRLPEGYVRRSDGLFEKVVEFAYGVMRERLLRDASGRLVRVERVEAKR